MNPRIVWENTARELEKKVADLQEQLRKRDSVIGDSVCSECGHVEISINWKALCYQLSDKFTEYRRKCEADASARDSWCIEALDDPPGCCGTCESCEDEEEEDIFVDYGDLGKAVYKVAHQGGKEV